MANVKLVFYGSEKSNTSEHSLNCYSNSTDEIFISIDMNNDFPFESFIVLDKETAIKLSRELRKQISHI